MNFYLEKFAPVIKEQAIFILIINSLNVIASSEKTIFCSKLKLTNQLGIIWCTAGFGSKTNFIHMQIYLFRIKKQSVVS
jgi:hypothetical protein